MLHSIRTKLLLTVLAFKAMFVVRVGFESAAYMFTEGSSWVLMVQKSGPIASPITFRVFDIGLVIVSKTFDAGVGAPNMMTITFNMTYKNNNVALEPDVVFNVSLEIIPPNPQIILDITEAVVTIIDDDDVRVGFESAAYMFTKGSSGVLMVHKSGPIASPITFRVFGIGLVIDSKTFDVGVGAPNMLTITFNMTDNNVALEPYLVFNVSLEIFPPNPQIVLTITEAVVMIVDDDVVRVGFESAAYMFNEGSFGVLMVQKSGPFASPITFRVFGLGPVIISKTFDAGVGAPNMMTVTFNTPDNNVALEPDVAFKVSLEIIPPNPLIVLDISEAVVTIIDDDVVRVGFESAAYMFAEGSSGVLMVQKSGPIAFPITFRVFGIGPVFISRTFYVGVGAPNMMTVTFNITDNNVALEPDVVFNVSLEIITPNPLIVSDITEAMVTIIDDDAVVTMEQLQYSTSEAEGLVLVCAGVVAGSLLQDLMLTLTTVDITAQSGRDYDGGTFSIFLDSSFSSTFSCAAINITQDSVIEAAEKFNVIVTTSAEFVTISEGTSVVNILSETAVRKYSIIGPLGFSMIFVPPERKEALCYNDIIVDGVANQFFNLISDTCLSVNALFTGVPSGPEINGMSTIGIRAATTEEQGGGCVNIEIDLENCTGSLRGQPIPVVESFGDIRIRKFGNRWRVSVPNCEHPSVVMWITCQPEILRFDVAKAPTLKPTSHGLLGQFWDVPIIVYKDDSRAMIQVSRLGKEHFHRFLALGYSLPWDHTEKTCYFNPTESMIQGTQSEYETSGLFDTSFLYRMFDDSVCN